MLKYYSVKIMFKKKSGIKNPCIHVCTLDDEKVCMGCYRSAEEVRNWFRYTDEQKLQSLENAESRRRDKEESNYDHYV